MGTDFSSWFFVACHFLLVLSTILTVGTEQCEVCNARNPYLPPALARWVDTPMGKLTLARLRPMPVAQLEQQLLALYEKQVSSHCA